MKGSMFPKLPEGEKPDSESGDFEVKDNPSPQEKRVLKEKPEETAGPKEWKIKQFKKIIEKYDSNVHLGREQRADLAEKADPGKSIVKEKDVKKTLQELQKEHSRATSSQDRSRINQEKQSLWRKFFKKK